MLGADNFWEVGGLASRIASYRSGNEFWGLLLKSGNETARWAIIASGANAKFLSLNFCMRNNAYNLKVVFFPLLFFFFSEQQIYDVLLL